MGRYNGFDDMSVSTPVSVSAGGGSRLPDPSGGGVADRGVSLFAGGDESGGVATACVEDHKGTKRSKTA